MKTAFYLLTFLISICGCSNDSASEITLYGNNSKTSQIGDLNDRCLDKDAWVNMTKLYSINSITDSSFISRLDEVKNYYNNPEYTLYFSDSPKEIIGCSYYSVKAVYNPSITEQVLDGLSPQLSDKEQVRIRNRVQTALMEFQCSDGKLESLEWMKRPAIFSEEFYKK